MPYTKTAKLTDFYRDVDVTSLCVNVDEYKTADESRHTFKNPAAWSG